MQTLTPLPHCQPDLDMTMTSDMPNLFGNPTDWGHSHHAFAKRPNANYLELSIPELRNSHHGPALRHDLNHTETMPTPMDAHMPTYDGFTHENGFNQPPEASRFTVPMYAPQPGFTALNTPNPALQNHINNDTVSPLQTSFEPSLHSSPGFSPDTATPSVASSTFGSISGPSNADPSSVKRRRHSTWTGGSGGGLSSPTFAVKPTGRRRQSENVEPGSARAIYLEKNRKAASKCRGKQRMQQQELVETAREMERKNKQLKIEVEFLKSDMRDLMTIVGRHSDCPDGRLKTYVQREADRLVSRDAAVVPAASAEAASSKYSSDEHSPPE